jgi:hypothetical protein
MPPSSGWTRPDRGQWQRDHGDGNWQGHGRWNRGDNGAGAQRPAPSQPRQGSWRHERPQG